MEKTVFILRDIVAEFFDEIEIKQRQKQDFIIERLPVMQFITGELFLLYFLRLIGV